MWNWWHKAIQCRDILQCSSSYSVTGPFVPVMVLNGAMNRQLPPNGPGKSDHCHQWSTLSRKTTDIFHALPTPQLHYITSIALQTSPLYYNTFIVLPTPLTTANTSTVLPTPLTTDNTSTALQNFHCTAQHSHVLQKQDIAALQRPPIHCQHIPCTENTSTALPTHQLHC